MTHLKRTREFAVGAGQGELKYGATRLIRFRPQLAPMSMDDRAAYLTRFYEVLDQEQKLRFAAMR